MPEPKGGYRPKRTELIDTQDRGICLGAVVDRSTDLPLAWQVMTQRLTDRLRHELGLVYSVASMYLPLDAATAYAYVGVDALEFQVEEIGLIPVGTDKATIARGELHRVATNRLLGHSEDPWETLAAERQAATPESLRAAFRAATDRAAVVGPGGDVLDLPRRRPTRHHALQGRLFRPKRYPPGGVERLVVAESGLSGRFSGEWFTVRWDEILVADKENPTRWALFHHDGSWLRIDAADFWRRRTLQRALDERIPSEVRLPAERRP